jgi:subtilase family serine protease
VIQTRPTKLSLFSPVALAGFATLFFPSLAAADSPLVTVAGSPDFHQFKIDSTAVKLTGTLRVGFGLAGFRKSAADAFVSDLYNRNSPNFHHWISTAQFGQYFGAPDSDLKALSDYLTSEGFTDINVAAGKNFVTATGTVQMAQKAFNTTFAYYVRPAELVAKGEPALFFGPRTPIQLPQELASKVVGAFGLDDLLKAHTGTINRTLAKKKKKSVSGFTPAQLAVAYNSAPFEAANRGQNMKIAVYSPTTRYKDDPEVFASRLGIPDDFDIVDIPIDGGNTTTGGRLEASADQEQIIGQAYHARLAMVEPATDTTGELDSFDWVGKDDIPVLSSSWDILESAVIAAKAQAFATEFENTCETLAADGISVFVASGDQAAYGSSGTQSVYMETCCPYVTSVGGTALYVTSSHSWSLEDLWVYNKNRSAPSGGGGGISKLFKLPSWQKGYGVSNTYSNGYREIPDVSANASSLTPYYVAYNGADSEVAGTSLATPLWASTVLLMEQGYSAIEGHTVKLGNMNPILYELGNEFENPNVDWTLATVFHDITIGNNGLYSCTAGYDLCSGWGSSNFGKLWTDYGAAEKIKGFAPDFEPYTPSGWNYPVQFHTTATGTIEPAYFEHGVKYYIAACSANIGTADGPAAEFTIQIDGTTVTPLYDFPSEPLESYYPATNVGTVTFTKGTHTIKFTVNAGASVYETNLANNHYTRTITVY